MRFLYVTDLHGDEKKYNKTLELAKEENVDLIVNGGDLYPKHCDRYFEQPEFILGFLDRYFSELDREGIRCLLMPGNDDLQCLDDVFQDVCDSHHNVSSIRQEKVKVDGYEFIGFDMILDHPFACKDRIVTEAAYVPQEQIAGPIVLSGKYGYREIKNWNIYRAFNLPLMRDVLGRLPSPKNPEKTVYVMHMPPADLGLGLVWDKSRDIGSWDIREFIEFWQPLATFHGHIHEAPEVNGGHWKAKIGKTVCIQPGQTEKGDAEMIYVVADLDKQEYVRKIAEV